MEKLIFALLLILAFSCAKVNRVSDGLNLANSQSDVTLTIEEHMSNSVKLSWEYQGPDPVCFRILKRINALPVDTALPAELQQLAVIGKVDSLCREFTDENVAAGELPMYMIRLCRDEMNGIYSNVANSNGATGITPPVLSGPIVNDNEISLNWRSIAEGVTQFRIFRRSGSGNFAQVATASAQAGLSDYSTTDVPAGDGYYIYRVDACTGSTCVSSDEMGVSFGVLSPGSITAFTALMLNGEDIIFEWNYSGPDCIFIFNMEVVANSSHNVVYTADSFKQLLSNDENIERSNNNYMARFPMDIFFSDFTDSAGYTINFEVYPQLGIAGSTVSTSISTDTTSAAYQLDASGDSISVSSDRMRLTLIHDYQADGFITSYGVIRKDCGSTSGCGCSASEVTLLNNNTFITGMNGVNPYFNEYYGSSHTDLQRTSGNNYCYRFTVSNGYRSSSTQWVSVIAP